MITVLIELLHINCIFSFNKRNIFHKFSHTSLLPWNRGQVCSFLSDFLFFLINAATVRFSNVFVSFQIR